MNTQDIQKFNTRLETEKKLLISELESLGRKDPASPGGWEASTDKMEVDSADENELADKMEELEENTQIMDQLEQQLIEVESALERIQNGTYGICETCKTPIEIARLEASPSAKTCVTHKK